MGSEEIDISAPNVRSFRRSHAVWLSQTTVTQAIGPQVVDSVRRQRPEMFKRKSEAPPRRARRVLRREVDWATRYMLEGSRDQQWREARVLDISRGGAGVELFGTTADQTRDHRVVLEFDLPPAMLRLYGEVRHLSPSDGGGVYVGLQFAGLSVLERDMLDSLLERDSAVGPMQRSPS
jgi:hypothetical protein